MKKNDSLKVKALKPKKKRSSFCLIIQKVLKLLRQRLRIIRFPKIKIINFVLYENSAHFF